MRTLPRTSIAALLSILVVAGCTAKMSGVTADDEPDFDEPIYDEEPSREAVSITEPTEGALLGTNFVHVEGTSTASTVLVEGEPVEVVDGRFETDLELSDGPASVTAVAGTARDSVSFFVDGAPPVVVVTSPPPGSYLEGGAVTVEGHVEDESVHSVDLAGATVPVGDDGTFSWTSELPPGAHRVRVAARDDAGHVGYGFTSFLLGEYAVPGTLLGRAAVLQLGTEALDQVGEAIRPHITPANLEPRILAENHIVSGFWGWLDATEYTHGAVDVDVSTGLRTITVEITVSDVALDVRADLRIGPDITGTATADRAIATVTAQVGTADGRPTVEILDTNVALVGLLVDVDGLWGWIDRNIVTNALRGVITSKLNDLAAERVPPALDSALERIPTSQVARLMGRSVMVRGEMRSFTASSTGLRGMLDLSVEATSPDETLLASAPGSLRLDVGYPDVTQTPDVRASLSLDLLNAVFFAAWSAAALETVIDEPVLGDAGPLTMGSLSALAPGLRGRAPAEAPVSLVVSAELPPVLQPADGDDTSIEARLVDLRVTAFAGGDVELFTLSIAITAPVRIALMDDEVSIDLTEWTLAADIVGDAARLPIGPDLDELLTTLLGPLAADFTRIEGLDIPQLRGFSTTDLRADLDRGYVVAEARLRYTP